MTCVPTYTDDVDDRQTVARSLRPMSVVERVRRTAAERPLMRATSGTFLLRVASAGILLASAVLLARGLGARGYGAYSYATAWATLLATPALLGFDRLLVRSMAAWKRDGRVEPHARTVPPRKPDRGGDVHGARAGGRDGGPLLLDDPFRAPFLLALALVPLIALTGVRRGSPPGPRPHRARQRARDAGPAGPAARRHGQRLSSLPPSFDPAAAMAINVGGNRRRLRRWDRAPAPGPAAGHDRGGAPEYATGPGSRRRRR